MKVVVMNFSGNVGKSTVARHLLSPRMDYATVFPVESINSDGTEDETLKGKQFGDLMEALMLIDDAVIDVGASNVEDFINQMKLYRGSHEDFDYFVIPTVPKTKQQKDTLSTIDALTEIGVPGNKIRLVFNMAEIDDDVKRIFAPLFGYHAAEKNFIINEDAVIRVNDIYGKLKGSERTISEIMNDTTDYKELIKQSTDPIEKVQYAQAIGIKRLAAGVVDEHDRVFKSLFK